MIKLQVNFNPSFKHQTRIMHRQKFGEFYFRTVVMEYFPAEQRKKTIASLAVLLEPSHYNFIDIDSTWGGLALDAKQFGTFGALGQNDFITSGRICVLMRNSCNDNNGHF